MSVAAEKRPALREAIAIAALAIAYFVAGRLGLAIPLFEPYVTLAWAPSGVALAALLLWGPRMAPGVFIGALAVNLSLGEPVAAGAAIAAGATLSAIAGAWFCLRIFSMDVRLTSMRDVLVLIFVGSIASSSIDASVGAIALHEIGAFSLDRAGMSWLGWWAANAQGVLFFAPLILAWAARPRVDRAAVKAAGLGVGLGAALLAVGVLLRQEFDSDLSQYMLALAMFPLLLWPAIHYPIREVATLNVMVATFCVVGTAADLGPFATQGASGAAALHGLLSLIALTTLILAARSAESRDAVRRLGESESRFRSLTALSADWYWEQDDLYRYVKFSSGFSARSGVLDEAFIGRTRWEIGHAPPDDPDWSRHRALLAARLPFRDVVVRLSGPDGLERFHAVSGEPVFDLHGLFTGYRGIGRDVTPQKRAEHALAASRELFATLFDGAPQPVMFRQLEDGVVTAVNDAWCEFYGLARERALGQAVGALGINCDPGITELIQDTLERRRGMRDFELRVRTAAGSCATSCCRRPSCPWAASTWSSAPGSTSPNAIACAANCSRRASASSGCSAPVRSRWRSPASRTAGSSTYPTRGWRRTASPARRSSAATSCRRACGSTSTSAHAFARGCSSTGRCASSSAAGGARTGRSPTC